MHSYRHYEENFNTKSWEVQVLSAEIQLQHSSLPCYSWGYHLHFKQDLIQSPLKNFHWFQQGLECSHHARSTILCFQTPLVLSAIILTPVLMKSESFNIWFFLKSLVHPSTSKPRENIQCLSFYSFLKLDMKTHSW